MAVIPMSYSPSAVERSFSVVNEFELAGRKLAVIFDEQTPRASIINLDPEQIDGSARHRVLAMLELQKKKAIGDNVIAVERFWQDDACVMQIEGVCVDKAIREAGLATILYETLVTKCGIILMSDNEQYEGGKYLWQKIASRSSDLAVFILDTDEGKFYPYDGTKVRYDGVSIPEEKIWSVHPDKSLWGLVLVAEDARRIAELAA
ncbi:N-acetyltransferase [Escherichia coli]|uniref:hypothetical protein n=1 Tax=Escherichia coli TaxID=562 RepID=UPI003965F9F0|nr:hypothetical protein [Escherichia coli]